MKKKTTTTTTKNTVPRNDSGVHVADSLQNVMTGLGTERDPRTFTKITKRAPMNVDELDTQYVEGDLENNIVAVPADDMTREWIDLQSSDKSASAVRIERELRAIKAQRVLREAVCWSRLTGGAIIVVGLDKQRKATDADGNVTSEPDLAQPAQPGRVMWLQVYDRFEVPGVDIGPDGEITHYRVLVGETQTRIHASRVLRLDTDPMPRRLRVDAGWGLSVLDRCREPIQNLDTAMSGVAVAMSRFSETVMHIDQLTKLLASDAGDVVKKKIATLNLMRSTFGLMVLDGNDKVAEVGRQFGGVVDMLDRLIERVASAARMPITKLMGRSPAGLNATGESDVRLWYDHVKSKQESDLRPVLEALIAMVAAGLGITIADDEEEDGVTLSFEFCPLWRPTTAERATTNFTQAQADQIYINAGVIDADTVARARFSPTGFSVETVVELDDPVDATSVDPSDLDPSAVDENGNPLPTPSTSTAAAPLASFNGAQVTAARDIVLAVASKQLPRDAGVGMLRVFFGLDEKAADLVMGTVGRSFEPAPPSPPVAG